MVSFIFATNRPWDQFGSKIVESIRSVEKAQHEIVVCATYRMPDYENVRFVLDEKNDGSTSAVNAAAEKSVGDWVLLTCDDHYLNPSFSSKLLRSDKEMKVINLGIKWSDCVCVGGQVYTYPVIPFPAIHRDTLKKLGGFFNPAMRHHFVGHWLGLWLLANGHQCDFNALGEFPMWHCTPNAYSECGRDDLDRSEFERLVPKAKGANYI